jgi:hypothetical protein
MKIRSMIFCGAVIALAFALGPNVSRMLAQGQGKSAKKPAAAAGPQKQDEEYTKLIKQYLQDPRITTELVDHMPMSSDGLQSPLKFFGRIPGTPGELTYSKDINRYYQYLANTSKRAKYFKIGTSEEGRDIVLLAIAVDRSAKDDGSAGAGAAEYRQADLLHHQRNAFAGNRRTGNADRIGVSLDG